MLHIQLFLIKTFQSILAIIKVLLLSKFNKYILKTNQDKDCLILGNGPSLIKMIKEQPDFIKGKDIVCVNFFPTTLLFEELKPSVFVTAAPEFWLSEVDQSYKTGKKEIITAMVTKTKWPLTVLIPFAAKKDSYWSKNLKENPNIIIQYFNNTGIEGWVFLCFWLFKRGLAMPRPHNVLIPAIFNAINMGYQRIYLWGADHNQILELSVDENNIPLINQKHFYDSNTSSPAVMKKMGKGKRKVHEILHKFMLTFEAYHVLNEYAEKRGTKIINATPNSLIDAFERHGS